MEAFLKTRQSFQAQSEAQCARFVSAFNSKHAALAKQFDALEGDWKELRAKMAAVQKEHGKEVEPNEFVRLNVGGKLMDICRSTLTICEGLRLEALFSGRWEKALRRDASGRIFIDDNAKCFKKMLTSLQRLKDSPADQVKPKHQIGGDQQPYFERMLEHYGVNHALGYPGILKAPSSSLLQDSTHRATLASWLDNPSCLQLLYRGTRDGWRAEDFHRLCDDQGETITVIKSASGCLFGGYADQPWQRRDAVVASSKAFLFTLNGDHGLSKINLLQTDQGRAIRHHVSSGPTFGCSNELHVGSGTQHGPGQVLFQVMATSAPSQPHNYGHGHHGGYHSQYTYYSLTTNPLFKRGWIPPAGSSSVIPAEIEIFKVNRDTKEAAKMWNAEPFAEAAGDDLNDALAQNVFKSMRNQEGALVEALEALHKAQAAFEDELTFVKPFIDKEEDIVRLNIMGSLVDVSLSVVRLHEESMLATLFDSKKWQAQPQNMDEDGRYLLEVSPFAFRKLIDVLRLHKLYAPESVAVPVPVNEKDDFNHMLSYLYPACEALIRKSIV